jgi:hypothetical protein
MAETLPPATKPGLKPWQKIVLIGLVLLVAAGLVVSVHGLLVKLPVGADFFTFWLAARAAFIDGHNPYSSAVTLQSQMGIYGRAAYAREDQVAFAYPPYSLFILLPLSGLTYPWAESIWLIANILLIVTVIYLSFPKSPKWLPFTYLAFYPVAFGLILGNFVVTISSILILFFGFFVARRDPPAWLQVLTGVLLAWSTTKPQFMWLFLAFILLTSIRYKYWLFLGSLAFSGLFFFALSFAVVPGWLPLWMGRVREYAGYVQSNPTINNLASLILPGRTGQAIALILAGMVIAITAWLVFRWFRRRTTDLELFLWFGLVTYFFHPHGISYEQLSLLVPLVCWVASLRAQKGWLYALAWFLPLLLSWIVFGLSKWVFTALDELPLVYFSILFAWILLLKPDQRINNSTNQPNL